MRRSTSMPRVHGTGQLDRAQEAAASFGIAGPGSHVAGPLLVLAGAGSGKTTTLVSRIQRLVVAGCDPDRILALTFSRRAAQELSTRIRAAVPEVAARQVGTFHSVAADLLRCHCRRLSLAPDFAILDRADALDLMAFVREGLPTVPGEPPLPPPAACLGILSETLNRGVPLHDVLVGQPGDLSNLEIRLSELYDRYHDTKGVHHSVDFDDLLTFLDAALSDPGFASDVAASWDHVLVDEYQDTNFLQDSILRALRPSGRGLTVVGDDAQAIYGFRGASVDGFTGFADGFDPSATVLRLETSYRCTSQILKLANDLLASSSCMPRTLVGIRDGDPPRVLAVEDDAAQARFVVDELVDFTNAGGDAASRAVLYRSSHHATAIEIELAGRRIPYVKRGGARWTESAHVRDLLAILRYAATPAVRSAGFRALQLLPGVGPSAASRIVAALGGGPLFELGGGPPGVSGAALPELAAFADGLATIAASPSAVRACAVAIDLYRPLAERRYVDATERLAELEPLLTAAATMPDLAAWLDDLALDPIAPDATAAGTSGMVTLSTVHAAKGLEWDGVTIVSCVEGSIPSAHAKSEPEIEEERRILYVAATRAASELTILVPRWGGRPGRRQSRKASRFIRGMDVPEASRAFETGGDRDANASRPINVRLAARSRSLNLNGVGNT